MSARPTLGNKVGAAIYVLSMLPDLPGVRTVHTLMWPRTTGYTTEDVRRHAVKVLASVCTATLEALPPARIAQIWTDQDEYLSFALDELPPGDACPSPATGAPVPAAQATCSRNAEGPCRRCQPSSEDGNGACAGLQGRPVILSAPAGWGKTQQAEQLRAEFGCSTVVDPWNLGPVTGGALHLTNVPPSNPSLHSTAITCDARLVFRGWPE